MRNSSIQHALSIPELLRRIFLYSSSRDNVQNACVCVKWSNEALNILWDHVTDPLYLFQLLAPLGRNSKGLFCFTRRIQPIDWVRFDKYSWRVHAIDFYLEHGYDPSVFLDIACGRSRIELLPNLRSWTGVTNLAILLLFSHAAVKAFTLYPSDLAEYDDPCSLLPYIPAKMPRLQVLSINIWHHPIDSIESEIVAMFDGLPSLKQLYLPCTWLTPKVTRAIASLEALEVLRSFAEHSSLQADVFSSTLDVDSFTALRELELAIPLRRAAVCLSQAYQPTALLSLDLWSPKVESAEDYGYVIKIVASNCRRLESFTLRHGSFRTESTPHDPITITTLKPITSCSELRSLQLSHAVPFELDADDLVSMVKALPSIVNLSLNPTPDVIRAPTLNISALSAILPFCDALEHLGLYLNASLHEQPLVDDQMFFENLERLFVGRSPITSPIPIAFFLSHVLPEGCRITYTTKPGPRSPDTRAKSWAQVQDLVPAFMRAREEGENAAIRRL